MTKQPLEQNHNEIHNDIIVGLAGHIDHGKTTLIKALNGFDGDTLEQEKQRGITLDLSFSNLEFNSRNVAFIDVPGHSKLVKNMIAGVFGIDVLLLVVAANEGIMPQSKEHIHIANLLGVKSCICVITKIDKLENKQKDLAELESTIKDFFKPLDMSLDSIFALSLYPSPSTQEIERLKQRLESIPRVPKNDYGVFVYYIDRSFAIQGAGCVVTGSVLSGECHIDEKLYIYNKAKEVSLKSIQVHNEKALKASHSQRVALNLAGISHNELKRGYLISKKGFLRGFDSIDVGIFGEVKHNATYTLHIGSFKLSAKVCILSSQALTSHAFGKAPLTLATLKSDEPIFGIYTQRFILRNDNDTLCGGVILNPIADPIKKHTRIALLESLAQKDFKQSFYLLTQIHKKGFGLVSSTQRFCLSHAQSLDIALNLNVFLDEKALTLYPLSQVEILKTHILEIFSRNKNALISAQSLNAKLKWASLALCQKALDELLSQGQIKSQNGLYLAKWCQIQNIQTYAQQSILESLANQGYAPLAPYNLYEELELDKTLGDNALKALTQAQKVVRIAHNLFITTTALQSIVSLMREILQTNGYIDVNLLRNHTQLSRKYLIAYLEYLDKFDDIVCKDNKRTLKYAPSSQDSSHIKG
nr:selenocysteine-specific translation elongation factor [uncultured Helicobacter sp.]